MTWQRLVALSGVAFAVLLVVGFLLSGGDTPDYTAPNHEWIKWAADNESNNRASALLILIAGYEFLLFAGSIRSGLGLAERAARGFTRLAHMAFAGAIVGITGLITAVVMIGAASIQGGDTNALVARAVIEATAGPFLLSSVGFATLLITAGIVALRTGAFARWTAVVAFIGGIAFLVTLLTVVGSNPDDSAFGIGYPIAFLCLAIWSVATSISNYRRLSAGNGSEARARKPSDQAV